MGKSCRWPLRSSPTDDTYVVPLLFCTAGVQLRRLPVGGDGAAAAVCRHGRLPDTDAGAALLLNGWLLSCWVGGSITCQCSRPALHQLIAEVVNSAVVCCVANTPLSLLPPPRVFRSTIHASSPILQWYLDPQTMRLPRPAVPESATPAARQILEALAVGLPRWHFQPAAASWAAQLGPSPFDVGSNSGCVYKLPVPSSHLLWLLCRAWWSRAHTGTPTAAPPSRISWQRCGRRPAGPRRAPRRPRLQAPLPRRSDRSTNATALQTSHQQASPHPFALCVYPYMSPLLSFLGWVSLASNKHKRPPRCPTSVLTLRRRLRPRRLSSNLTPFHCCLSSHVHTPLLLIF